MIFNREAFQAAVKLWGASKQLRMVAEEAAELNLAVLKLMRAQDRFCELSENDFENLEKKAIERALLNAEKDVIEESSDVWLMLEQLPFIISGEYTKMKEQKYAKFIDKLRNHGVDL